ncbi:MAG TPA: SGNH/GDSL hydrolase family protein [Burkholderiaceae bacterium]
MSRLQTSRLRICAKSAVIRAASWLPFFFGVLSLHAQTTGLPGLMSGDCASDGGGNVVCTKTGGVSFAPSATVDATNVSNATSGTLSRARGGTGEAGGVSGIRRANGMLADTAASGADLAALGVPATQARVLYQKSYWSDLSDFTVTGAAPTIANGQIVLDSQAGSTSGQVLTLNRPGVTLDENIDLEVYLTVGSAPSGSYCQNQGTNYGIVAGKMSVSGVAKIGLVSRLNTYVGFLELNAFPDAVAGAVAVPVQQAWSSCPNAGDSLRLVYSQRGNIFTVVYDDFTTGVHQLDSAMDNLSQTTGTRGPNASRLGIAMYGGAFTVTGIRAVSRTPANVNVAFVQDSKYWGANSGARSLRFEDRLSALGPIAVYGGQADRTAETMQALADAIAAKPKYIVMGISRNSVCNGGEATETWQANYAAMVAQVKAAGIVPVHLLAIPETSGCDQSAGNSYLNTNYAMDARIDPSAGFVTATDVSGDSIHPTQHGMAVIASDILASGAIAPAVNGTQIAIPGSLETYADAVAPVALLNLANTFAKAQTAAGFTASNTDGSGFHANLFTPAASNAGCNAGDFADDANYHYVCTGTNTWKRVALSSF